MHALPPAPPKSSKEDDATRWPDHRKTPTTTVSRRSCRTGSYVDAAASTTTTKQSSRCWRASPSSASTSSWRSPGPTHGDHLRELCVDLAARRNRRRSTSLVVAIPGSFQFGLSTSRDQPAPSQLSPVP